MLIASVIQSSNKYTNMFINFLSFFYFIEIFI